MFVHTPKGAFAKPAVHVVTSVGRSWIMWNMEKMTLVFVGESKEGGLVVDKWMRMWLWGTRKSGYEDFLSCLRDEVMPAAGPLPTNILPCHVC
jgi:hypothetical protein